MGIRSLRQSLYLAVLVSAALVLLWLRHGSDDSLNPTNSKLNEYLQKYAKLRSLSSLDAPSERSPNFQGQLPKSGFYNSNTQDMTAPIYFNKFDHLQSQGVNSLIFQKGLEKETGGATNNLANNLQFQINAIPGSSGVDKLNHLPGNSFGVNIDDIKSPPKLAFNDAFQREPTPLQNGGAPPNGVQTGVESPPGASFSGTKSKRVVLMSYMRSGSTFTGDLFQLSPDVFYFYEPLLYTRDIDILGQKTHIRDRVEAAYRHKTGPPEVLDFTMATLTCNVTSNNMAFLTGLSFSKSMKAYQTCTASKKGGEVDSCRRDLMARCAEKKVVLAKILRLHMWEIDDLLTRDTEVKVIHLVRDPRGIYVSRAGAHYFFSDTTFCPRFNKDGALSPLLQTKFPGRLLTVRYEDLAMNPVEMTKKLYDFAGVPWNSEIARNIVDLTSPSNTEFKEMIFDTRRKNSSSTAFQWRNKIPFQQVEKLQRNCLSGMENYGYLQFRSNFDLKNSNVSSMSQKYSDAYFKAQVL